MKVIKCPYCKNAAVWCENKEIYGKNYGKSYMCWLCKPCNAYVSCHNNSKSPQGTLANAELREWRKKVHERIDPMWRSGSISRKDLYKQLNKVFSRAYHTGECNIEQCKKILDLFPEPKEFVRPTLENLKIKYKIISKKQGIWNIPDNF